MRLLIFLVLSRYGLACKYRIYLYQYIIECRIKFPDISGIKFSYFKIKLQLIGYLNLLRQSRWFVTR